MSNPESEDRLSDLPDCLIHRIFSFIDSIYLVQASVLGRRWRHLYVSTPVLSLCFETASPPPPPPPLNFVQWLLAGRPSPSPAPTRARVDGGPVFRMLPRIHYAYNQIFVPGTIETFVSSVVQRGALEQLELTTTDLSRFQLPTCLYTTRSLKVLTLRSDLIRLPRDAVFPFLKKLHLEHTKFIIGAFDGGSIISGCPNLETLILKNCKLVNTHKSLSISAPKLTTLAILYTQNLYNFATKDWEFVITAPSLTCFTFTGDWAVNFHLASPCPLLYQVGIDLVDCVYSRTDRAFSLIPMLNVFKHATIIKLSRSTHQYLSEARDLLQVVSSSDYKIFYPSEVEGLSNKL